MQIPTSTEKLLAITKVIAAPDKFFYSSFPEFSPLEFEHFCAFLLQKDGHSILELNSKQEADGGIDIITQKDEQIWVIQVKKSDWNTGKKSKDYISLETVDRHFGVVCRKEVELKEKYGQEVLGYFMTLRRFSSHTLAHFASEKRMKFCELKELKKLIVDLEVLNVDLGMVVWQDLELARIKEEISILEKLISEKDVEIQTLQNKISSVEKVIMLELLDLYRLLDLLKFELKFIQDKKISQKMQDEKLTAEFVQNQQKIDEEYENLEREYVAKKITVLSELDQKKFKQVYRQLMHRFHPDKNPNNRENYEKITKSITAAKETQDLTLLEDIANFPEKYFGGILPEEQDNKQVLAKFVVQLQEKLAQLDDQIDLLQSEESLGLYELWSQNELSFNQFLAKKKAVLTEEISQIREQVEALK